MAVVLTYNEWHFSSFVPSSVTNDYLQSPESPLKDPCNKDIIDKCTESPKYNLPHLWKDF